MTMKKLDSAQILALSKLIPKKDVDAARQAMDEEGEDFDLDFNLHVQGHLEIGPVTSGNQVNKLCPQRLLMAAMNKLNAVTLNSIIKDALAIDKDSQEFKGWKKRTETAWKKMADSTHQKRMGSVKFAEA